MDKSRRRELRDTFGLYALRATYALLRVCPFFVIRLFSAAVGRLVYALASKERRLVLENLGVAFSEWTPQQRKRCARRFFVLLVKSPLQTIHAGFNKDRLDRVAIRGREHLDRALRSGKGVIVLTAHLGNFTLMHLKLAHAGYPVVVMQRPIKSPKVNQYITRFQQRIGVRALISYPRTEAVKGLITALRENRLVFIMMDQDFGDQGVWVRFFGRLASTASGPVVMALRTQAVLLPVSIHTDAQGADVITVMPGQELMQGVTKQETILLNTAACSRIIESWVRAHPEQWGWIHRRWRTQPQEADYALGKVEA